MDYDKGKHLYLLKDLRKIEKENEQTRWRYW